MYLHKTTQVRTVVNILPGVSVGTPLVSSRALNTSWHQNLENIQVFHEMHLGVCQAGDQVVAFGGIFIFG